MRCIGGHQKIATYIIVDNASMDDTCAIVRAELPSARLIENKENIGFAVACNQALAQVSTELALLMNPDATIDEAGIDSLMQALASYPDAAIAAPFFTHSKRGRPTKLEGNIVSAPFVSGAIMLWRMGLMRKIGFFDPAFFLFYEDDDICIRTRRAGYRLLVISGVTGFHTPGQSCAAGEALNRLKLQSFSWSRLYFTKKYYGAPVALILALWQAGTAWLASMLAHEPHERLEQRSRFESATRFLRNQKSFR